MKEIKELKKPIIFIGTGRSGTTIISEVIMRHPDLAFPCTYQEVLYRYPAACLSRHLFDNRWWRIFGQKKQLNKVGLFNYYYFRPAEAYNMWDYLVGEDLSFSQGFLHEEKLSPERIQFIRDYFRKVVRYQGRKRLTFKITGPARMGFLLQIFPDAIFINLKRNKIPTISSFLKVDFWQTLGKNKLWWSGVYTDEEKVWVDQHSDQPSLITAYQLKKVEEVTRKELEQYRPEYLEVNYEDFVVDPKREIRRIVDFAELGSYDLLKYLEEIEIHNRNKKDTDYFSEEELEKIYQVLQPELQS